MCKSSIYGRKWLRDKYNPLGLPWKEQWSAFSLSLEGLFFHAPYSVSNQSNKPVGNLEMCEIRVNTHTHTHILTGIPRALIYLFSKRYTRMGTLFSGVFRPFPYSYVLFYPPSN